MKESLKDKIGNLAAFEIWNQARKDGNTKMFDWAISCLKHYKKIADDELKEKE